MSVNSPSDVRVSGARSWRHAFMPVLAIVTLGVVTTLVRVPADLGRVEAPAAPAKATVASEPAAPAPVVLIPAERSVRDFQSIQITNERQKAFTGFIADAAREHRIDPALIHAVIHAESNFAPKAKSRVGAQGLMQLMPATAAEVGLRQRKMLHDPRANIFAGAAYLSKLADRFGPTNPDLIIAAYNAGPGAVEKWGGIPPYAETQGYVKKVRQFWGESKRAPVTVLPG